MSKLPRVSRREMKIATVKRMLAGEARKRATSRAGPSGIAMAFSLLPTLPFSFPEEQGNLIHIPRCAEVSGPYARFSRAMSLYRRVGSMDR
jgi:hypothetical protein